MNQPLKEKNVDDKKLSRIFEGSLLRIEFSPRTKSGGLEALEATVMGYHDRGDKFTAVMWLRPFFDGQCEVVFDREKKEWEMFVRIGADLYQIPLENVVVLEEGLTNHEDFSNLSL